MGETQMWHALWEGVRNQVQRTLHRVRCVANSSANLGVLDAKSHSNGIDCAVGDFAAVIRVHREIQQVVTEIEPAIDVAL